MLGCDTAQEETDKKQVAWTMTDTESDSGKQNIEYSTELPNVERFLSLLVGIFMDCRVQEVTTKTHMEFQFRVFSLNTQH